MENKLTETAVKPTKEEIARIFMQYWGQKMKSTAINENVDMNNLTCSGVIWDANGSYFVGNYTGHFFSMSACSLLLKTVSGISKTECLETYHYLFPTHNSAADDVKEFTIMAALGQLRLINYVRRYDSLRYNEVLKLTDWLRQKGYALPYGPWSAEQLEEFGIYKLIRE